MLSSYKINIKQVRKKSFTARNLSGENMSGEVECDKEPREPKMTIYTNIR